jgi:hypothetical protein
LNGGLQPTFTKNKFFECLGGEKGRNDHQYNREFKKLYYEFKTEHKHNPIGLPIACVHTLIVI